MKDNETTNQKTKASNSVKVLLATGIFPPQIGGPATYAKLLYDELPKQGIDIEVANFGDYIDKPKIIRHFLYFLELLRKSMDADLVYALDPVSVGLPALLASQIRNKKLVLRVAGDYAWEQGTQRWGVSDSLDQFVKEHDKYSWKVKLFKKIQSYVAEGAYRIVVPSEYLKKIVTTWNVVPEKISVVYNGFHVSVTKALKPSIRKKLSLSGEVIVSSGRLVPWKGMVEVVSMMPDILKSIPTAYLVIIGDGPERERIEKEISKLKLEDHVRLTGRLSQDELFEYIKAADVFVLNTAYEGLSHLILETMSIGTPVVTTDVGGNPEVIEHGRSGALLTPNDKESFVEAIVGFLSERAIAFSIAKQAKKKVGKFTDEEMLSRISKELQSLI